MSENNLNLRLQSFAHGDNLISLKATQGKTKGIKNMRITMKSQFATLKEELDAELATVAQTAEGDSLYLAEVAKAKELDKQIEILSTEMSKEYDIASISKDWTKYDETDSKIDSLKKERSNVLA
jgi:hypothetical protein